MKLADIVKDPAEDWFDKLANAINLPDAKYEAADRSYKSVSKWLEREGSQFEHIDFDVYTQGSFRLGTAIQPFDRDEEYDLDIVCEFKLPKPRQTQASLHAALGRELQEYAQRYGMDSPSAWDRCWTLNYADSAQFHMDVLPCVPDASRQRQLLESQGLPLTFVESSVSITDRKHPKFSVISDDWPASNPNGYAQWFYERMRPAFEARRRHIMLTEDRADVADIPDFRVRTPLQLAIQILKRHRDVYFSTRDPALRPASIIITTLAAHAYQQESTVLQALNSILQTMPIHIAVNGGRYVISNPSAPRENFADAWNENPAKAQAFMAWARAARLDFVTARGEANPAAFINELAPRLGRNLMESAFASTPTTGLSNWKVSRLIKAKHRQAPEWPVSSNGKVTLTAQVQRNGFRTQALALDGADVSLESKLTFRAETTVPAPYDVFWQVVNTGMAATDADDLRGTFDRPKAEHGHLSRTEHARYPGTHSIECFIVKNGFVAARSGLFVVNIGASKL